MIFAKLSPAKLISSVFILFAYVTSQLSKTVATNSPDQTLEEYQLVYGNEPECSPLVTEWLEDIQSTVLQNDEPMDIDTWPELEDAMLTFRKFEMDAEGCVQKTTLIKNEDGTIDKEYQTLIEDPTGAVRAYTINQKSGNVTETEQVLESRTLIQYQRGLEKDKPAYVVEITKAGHDCGFV